MSADEDSSGSDDRTIGSSNAFQGDTAAARAAPIGSPVGEGASSREAAEESLQPDATRVLAEEAHARVDKLQRELRGAIETIAALEGMLGATADRSEVERLRERLGSAMSELRADVEARDARAAAKQRSAQQAFDDYLELSTALPVGGVAVVLQERDALAQSLERQRARTLVLELALEQEAAKRARADRELLELRAMPGSQLLSQLEARERDLQERSARVKSVDALELRNAELEAEVTALRASVRDRADEIRSARQTEEQRALIDELREQQALAQSRFNRLKLQREGLQRERDDVFASNHELGDRLRAMEVENEGQRAALEEELGRRDAREEELRRLYVSWRQLQRAHDERGGEVRDWAERCRDAERERDQANEQLRDAANSVRASVVQQERERFESTLDGLRADYEANVNALRSDLDERQAQLDAARHDARAVREATFEERRQAALELLRQRSDALDEVTRERAALDQMVAELRGRSDVLTRSVEDRTTKVSGLELKLADLQSRIGPLTDEVARLEDQRRRLAHIDLDRTERLQKLMNPFFTPPAPRGEAESEAAWLDAISVGIREAGFIFSKRLLYAFHTSLKNARYSPLTVLAGISGTGKSELPRLYADLGGLSFLNIAVQPSWDSPDDMFGFFNYTEGRYRATDLARVLYQIAPTDTHAPLDKHVVLVLLDEMNIARVEYYFAELLSKLETRRNLDRNSRDAGRASVTIDVGGGTESLFLDHNLLFVGTMNEDETTLTLSDKVKDRAQVITFPSPREFRGRATKQVAPRAEPLARATWDSWQAASRQLSDADRAELEQQCLHFNEALQGSGRAIGHRVVQAIVQYVAAYPTGDDASAARRNAISDVFAQKLLPKLVGVETGSEAGRETLDRIEGLLPNDLAPAFARGRRGEYFGWEGSRAINEAGT